MRDLAGNLKQSGNPIRRARKRLGESQAQLGERSGLRQETVSLIEAGNPATKLDRILAVVDREFEIGARSKGKLPP
ncbi:MAG: helix-turn-helix transcriptional regulator [Acetobacteraceae bacterium]